MKKILIILLTLVSVQVFGQVPLAGYITTIGPSDTYPVTLDSLGYGGYRVVSTKAALNNITSQRRVAGMTAYVIATDSTYQLRGGITNTNWVAVSPGDVISSITGLLPGGLKGQIMKATLDNNNKYTAEYAVKFGNYVSTQAQLDSALATAPISQATIFNTWKRFAHGGRSNNPGSQQKNDTIPSNPSQTNSWAYNAGTNTISSTFNSGPLLGFSSKNKYASYTLKATLGSTDTDNDRIGFVIAYVEDATDMVGNNAFGMNPSDFNWPINVASNTIPDQHTITLLRNREDATRSYMVYYDYGKLSEKVIANGSTLGLFNPTSGWNGNSVDVQVIRRGDSVFVSTSNMSDAPGGKGALSYTMAFTLTSDPVLTKFRGAASLGFCVNSQASSTFTNLNINTGDQDIYDLRNGNVYVAAGGTYTLSPTRNFYTENLPGTFLYNTPNKAFYYTKNDTTGYVRLNTDSAKRLVYNVKDYGATGNGVTIDNAGINAAENAAYTAGGGIVFFPEGRYLVRPGTTWKSRILKVRSGVSFIGSGKGATYIINDPTTPVDTVESVGKNTAIIGIGEEQQSVSNVTIRDLTVIGNSSIINGGLTSYTNLVDYFGIAARFQVSSLADTTLLKSLHADNVVIEDVDIKDVLWGVGASKSILGQFYQSYLSASDTSIKKHTNWKLNRVTIEGVFNRAIEFSFAKDITIQNTYFKNCSFLHLLSGCENINILNNHIVYGGDPYSHDRQGHLPTGTLDASGLRINYGNKNILISGNIIEASPNINPAIDIAAAFAMRYEPPGLIPLPQTQGLISLNNKYINRYTTAKNALTLIGVNNPITMKDFSFTNDEFVGTVDIGTQIGSNRGSTLLRNWKFNNCSIDSIGLPQKSATAGSGDFTFSGTTIKTNVLNNATSAKFINSTLLKRLTTFSFSDSTVVDNTRYTTLTQSAANTTTMFRNMPFITTTATDATYSLRYTNQIVNLPVITANRTVSLNASALYAGQTAIIRNGNTTAFTWSFAASTVYNAQGVAVTTIPSNATVTIMSNDDGTWKLTSIVYGMVTPANGGGTGLSTYAVGDILAANTTSTLQSVADVATGNVLRSGGVGALPAYGKVNLTTDVTGALPATNGGTAQSTFTTGDLIYASGTNTLAKRAIGATGNVLTVVGGVPTWAAPATGGTVTSFAFANGGGFTGAVTNPTTTPTLALTLQDAGAAQSGQVNNTTQTFGGIKTFNNTINRVLSSSTEDIFTATQGVNTVFGISDVAGATAFSLYNSGSGTVFLNGGVGALSNFQYGRLAIGVGVGGYTDDATKSFQVNGKSRLTGDVLVEGGNLTTTQVSGVGGTSTSLINHTTGYWYSDNQANDFGGPGFITTYSKGNNYVITSNGSFPLQLDLSGLSATRIYQGPDKSGKLALQASNTNSATSTLTLSEGYYTFTGTTATWTLPSQASSGLTRFVLINSGSGNITVNTNGGENKIWESGVLSTTLSIAPGEVYTLYNNAINFIVIN